MYEIKTMEEQIMKAEIISISSDLLQGKTQDQNVAFLGRELSTLGMDVRKSTMIKDDPDVLKATIEQAETQSDFLVLLGGLGPDENDITKQTLSAYLDLPLVLDQPTEDKIITYHQNSNFVMPDSNQLQALILHDSVAVRNVTGLAVGFFLKKDRHSYLLLPGPFDEMKHTFLEEAKPIIEEKLLTGSYVETRILRLFGISEVELIKKLTSFDANNVVIYPIDEEIEIQITIHAKDKERAVEEADKLKDDVHDLVREYVFAEESKTLLATVKELLTDEGLMITAAESLTGGQLMSDLSSLQEASMIFNGGMVTYSNDVKNQNLGVTKKTIEQHGVVSAQCAFEMAEKVRGKFNVDIGVSLTGVAGPSSLEGEIPGTVWLGIAKKGVETFAKKYHFAYKRNKNRQLSVATTLDMVRRVVLGETFEGIVTRETVEDDKKKEELK